MKAVHNADASEENQRKAGAVRKMHTEHGTGRNGNNQKKCSDKGCTAQFLSSGIADRRVFYTERDTDFAPRGRNKGTTVVHAVVGKFIVLWHSDEFKPIYIKERLLANPFSRQRTKDSCFEYESST